MRKTVALLIAVLVAAPFAWAEEHPDMEAARVALESAKSHLQSAGHEYAGHRVKALERVNQALEQIRLGLATSGAVDNRLEKRQGRLERRGERIDKRIEALKQRQQQQDVR